MITREQLELAAKAAGMNLSHWEYDADGFRHRKHKGIRWEPHEDHGQLLDLAVACRMEIDLSMGELSCQRVDRSYLYRDFILGDFASLAEAVITAAAEKQLAKESNHVAP